MSLGFETLLWHLAFTVYALVAVWSFFSIIFEYWGFILNTFQNQGSYQDAEPPGDIELGEIRSNGDTSGQIPVLPAVCETQLTIPEPKELIISAAVVDTDNCAICLEGLEEREVCWVLVKCDHVFHKPCLEQWLKIKLSCPICRTDAFPIIIDV